MTLVLTCKSKTMWSQMDLRILTSNRNKSSKDLETKIVVWLQDRRKNQ